MTQTARIIFAGSPDFAVPALRALEDSQHEVLAVLTQPDRPAGRGQRLRASPVKEFALSHDLPVLQPDSLREPSVQEALRNYQPDCMVVVAYGLLLPPEVLAIPRLGCINVHASLLPRWRGASPIQAAVLAGDAHSGVCLMQMNEGLDTGPVILQQQLNIKDTETASELHDRLAEMGASVLLEAMEQLMNGNVQATPQPETGVSYAGRISKTDAEIDWTAPAIDIDRQVRAFNAWPVAQTRLADEQLRCWRGYPDAATSSDKSPGEVIAMEDDGIRIQTGAGSFILTEAQLPGRQHISGRELGGSRCPVGTVLGK